MSEAPPDDHPADLDNGLEKEFRLLAGLGRNELETVRSLVTDLHETRVALDTMKLQCNHFKLQNSVYVNQIKELEIEQSTQSLQLDQAEEKIVILEDQLRRVASFEGGRNRLHTPDTLNIQLLAAKDQKIEELSMRLNELWRENADLQHEYQSTTSHLTSYAQSLELRGKQLSDELAKRSVLYACHERRAVETSRVQETTSSELKEENLKLQGINQLLQSQLSKLEQIKLEYEFKIRELNEIVVRQTEEIKTLNETNLDMSEDYNEARAQIIDMQVTIDRLKGSDFEVVEMNHYHQMESRNNLSQRREEELRKQLDDAKRLLADKIREQETFEDSIQMLKRELFEKDSLLHEAQAQVLSTYTLPVNSSVSGFGNVSLLNDFEDQQNNISYADINRNYDQRNLSAAAAAAAAELSLSLGHVDEEDSPLPISLHRQQQLSRQQSIAVRLRDCIDQLNSKMQTSLDDAQRSFKFQNKSPRELECTGTVIVEQVLPTVQSWVNEQFSSAEVEAEDCRALVDSFCKLIRLVGILCNASSSSFATAATAVTANHSVLREDFLVGDVTDSTDVRASLNSQEIRQIIESPVVAAAAAHALSDYDGNFDNVAHLVEQLKTENVLLRKRDSQLLGILKQQQRKLQVVLLRAAELDQSSSSDDRVKQLEEQLIHLRSELQLSEESSRNSRLIGQLESAQQLGAEIESLKIDLHQQQMQQIELMQQLEATQQQKKRQKEVSRQWTDRFCEFLSLRLLPVLSVDFQTLVTTLCNANSDFIDERNCDRVASNANESISPTSATIDNLKKGMNLLLESIGKVASRDQSHHHDDANDDGKENEQALADDEQDAMDWDAAVSRLSGELRECFRYCCEKAESIRKNSDELRQRLITFHNEVAELTLVYPNNNNNSDLSFGANSSYLNLSNINLSSSDADGASETDAEGADLKNSSSNISSKGAKIPSLVKSRYSNNVNEGSDSDGNDHDDDDDDAVVDAVVDARSPVTMRTRDTAADTGADTGAADSSSPAMSKSVSLSVSMLQSGSLPQSTRGTIDIVSLLEQQLAHMQALLLVANNSKHALMDDSRLLQQRNSDATTMTTAMMSLASSQKLLVSSLEGYCDKKGEDSSVEAALEGVNCTATSDDIQCLERELMLSQMTNSENQQHIHKLHEIITELTEEVARLRNAERMRQQQQQQRLDGMGQQAQGQGDGSDEELDDEADEVDSLDGDHAERRARAVSARKEQLVDREGERTDERDKASSMFEELQNKLLGAEYEVESLRKQTADYSDQITSLRSQLQTAQLQIDRLTAENFQLATAFAKLSEDYSQLEVQLPKLQQLIANAEMDGKRRESEFNERERSAAHQLALCHQSIAILQDALKEADERFVILQERSKAAIVEVKNKLEKKLKEKYQSQLRKYEARVVDMVRRDAEVMIAEIRSHQQQQLQKRAAVGGVVVDSDSGEIVLFPEMLSPETTEELLRSIASRSMQTEDMKMLSLVQSVTTSLDVGKSIVSEAHSAMGVLEANSGNIAFGIRAAAAAADGGKEKEKKAATAAAADTKVFHVSRMDSFSLADSVELKASFSSELAGNWSDFLTNRAGDLSVSFDGGVVAGGIAGSNASQSGAHPTYPIEEAQRQSGERRPLQSPKPATSPPRSRLSK